MITLSLSFPPSANRLWRSVKGRVLRSAEYTRWLLIAVLEARYTTRGTIAGPYALTILADRPDKRARDLDNLPKATQDALVTAGLIADDSNARKITLEWSTRPAGKGARIHITITPMEGA